MTELQNLEARLSRLERQVFRWKVAFVALGALLSIHLFIGVAGAFENYATVGSLLATTGSFQSLDARRLKVGQLEAQDISVASILIKDSQGRLRGKLGVDSFGLSKSPSLELFTDDGSQGVVLKTDAETSSLFLMPGKHGPSLNLWASNARYLPTGLQVRDEAFKSRISLELKKTVFDSGSSVTSTSLHFADAEEKSRVYLSSGAFDGGELTLVGKFGIMELGQKITSNSGMAEPRLRISSVGGEGEVAFGIERGEPVGSIRNGGGATVWEPTFSKPGVDKGKVKRVPESKPTVKPEDKL